MFKQLVPALGLLALSLVCQAQSSPQSSTKLIPRRADPKCAFLREEYARTRKDGESYLQGSDMAGVSQVTQLVDKGKSVEDLAKYIAEDEANAARLGILSADIKSCDRGQPLSAMERLPLLDAARQRQVSRVESRWIRLGGIRDDESARQILSRVNGIYDDEAKSFYNSDTVHITVDSDIVKDYPAILSLVEESSLPVEQKRFLQDNAKYLKYEEAGRLFNILKGIDKAGSLGYAYSLRKALAERAQQANLAAQAESAKSADKAAAVIGGIMTWVWVGGSVVLAVVVCVVLFRQSKGYAKYSAIRSGQLRKPYWWGLKELILWEPGEAVVLLRDKHLVTMADATGGYASISAWSGEEYKGRITYKSQMMKYTSDPIHTSDGISVKLDLGIWWHIQNPNLYVSRIASDYHVDGSHRGQSRGYTDTPTGEKYFDGKLKETAEEWIRVLAGSSLREHICQLTAGKLISPYIQSYIHRYFDPSDGETSQYENRMHTVLGEAEVALNGKTEDYGVRIERLEVQELKLPSNLETKLETVRVSFLEPARSSAETEAKTIEKKGLNQVQLEALSGLAAIIGKDGAAKIEFLKALGIAKIPFVAPYAPPFSALQTVFTNPRSVLGNDATDNAIPPRSSPDKIVNGGIEGERKPGDATGQGTDNAA
jgi:regulator of protease activity HflC (stomatin/prohibitin superfamily)